MLADLGCVLKAEQAVLADRLVVECICKKIIESDPSVLAWSSRLNASPLNKLGRWERSKGFALYSMVLKFI